MRQEDTGRSPGMEDAVFTVEKFDFYAPGSTGSDLCSTCLAASGERMGGVERGGSEISYKAPEESR